MDYTAARRNMVGCQLRTNSLRDPDLSRVLAEVPRELFLPQSMRAFAYLDEDLAVGGGRWLIEPMVLARLLEAAGIKASDVVLMIGDATGYATAVAAKLAGFVVALDCDGDWVQKAAGVLAELGIDNVDMVHGPLLRGHGAKAPYDAIVFAGAIGEIPDQIRGQLGEGGRLAAVVEAGPGRGKLVTLVRSGEDFRLRELFDASLPALPGLAATPRFEF